MRRFPLSAALAAAVVALPAFAQTSVEIRTGPDGQLSGSATAGSVGSSVRSGQPDSPRAWDERTPGQVRSACPPGERSRSVRVVSPDGSVSSSSSSSSTSSGGAVSASGSGSPGSRIYDDGCPERAAAAPAPRRTVHRAVRHRAVHRRH